MKLKLILAFLFVALSICLQQTYLMSNSAAPPAGHTGSPNTNLGATCATTGCHTSGVGIGNVNVSITYNGNPVSSYFPNNQYLVTVTVSGTGNIKSTYGFATRAEKSTGSATGAFSIITASTTGVGSGEAHHINASGATNSWSFYWTAPPTNVGNVTFYTAGNYADSSMSSSGDYIATTTNVLTPLPTTAPTAALSVSPNDTICINLPVTFTDLHTGSPIKYYSFYPGTGSATAGYGTPPATFTHTYTAAGTYQVVYWVSTDSPATGQSGSIDTFKKTITVINYPDASFGAVLSPGCNNGRDTLRLFNPNASVVYTPNYGTATPVGSAPNGGPYPIVLQSTPSVYEHFSMIATGFGCASPPYADSVLILGCTPPTASFSIVDSFYNPISNTCNNTGYYVLDGSSSGSGGGQIISWQWNFNVTNNPHPPIPATATGQGPHHILFPASGVYTFSLTVTDASGLTNTTTNLEVVNPCGPYLFIAIMNPAGNPLYSCLHDSILFSDNSDGTPVSWRWNWGDGSPIDTLPTLYHVWNSIGTFTVSMAAKDTYGTWDTAYTTVVVGTVPAAAAGNDTLVCLGSSLTIGKPAQNGAVYSWSSSPAGFSSTNANPTVSPLGTTTYYLQITNANATCFSYDTLKVVVDTAPNVILSATSLSECPNNDDTISASPSNLPYYSFNYPGGALINTPLPNTSGPYVLSWSTAGAHTVTCVAKTAHGCASTVTPVTITTPLNCNPPVAYFNAPANGCTLTQININDSSTGNPNNWYWFFGAGATPTNSVAQNPTVSYSSTGQHIVTLTVSNAGGSSVYSDTIMIYDAPSSLFNFVNPVCAGYSTIINYTGNASPSANYVWTFAGGNVVSGSGQGPIYVNWNLPGTKNVTLTVDEYGCYSSTTNNPILVLQNPIAKFSYNILPNTAYVTFINQSSGASSYHWAFGDGSTSIVQNPPTHNYINAGSYSVTLTAIGSNGNCANDSSRVITLNNVAGIGDVFNFSPYGMLVFHNDMTNVLHIKFTNPNTIAKNIELININGQVIYSANTAENADMQIGTTNFAAGVYLLKAEYPDGNIEVRKWIKN